MLKKKTLKTGNKKQTEKETKQNKEKKIKKQGRRHMGRNNSSDFPVVMKILKIIFKKLSDPR